MGLTYGQLDCLIIFIIASGGFFCIIYSLLIFLTVKRKKIIYYLHGGMFLLFGVCSLCDTYYRIGTEKIAPYLLYLDYPLIYLLGPLVIFYFRNLLSDSLQIKKWDFLFTVPFFLILAAFFPYFILPSAAKLALFPLETMASGYLKTICIITEFGKCPWMVLCIGTAFVETSYIWKKRLPSLRFVTVYLALWIVLALSITYANLFNQFALYRIDMFLGTIMIIILAFQTHRNSEFFQLIRKETSALKYANSRLKGIDKSAILERIGELMEFEETYKNANLTLKIMSRKLKISPEQLSEIINQEYNQNFNSYINNFKIAEAKKKLIENPVHNILEIALLCGFNSKSTFNAVFKKEIGKTPTEYRNSISGN